MNPADVSYRTSRLIGYLPIAPDNMVRDHRTIAFFDLTELDRLLPPYTQWQRRVARWVRKVI